MNKQQILLISFGQFEKELLMKIAAAVKIRFGCEVNTTVSYSELGKYYDPARCQYDANLLLKHIDSTYASRNIKAIGLFRVDLFIPILTYIIGQAIYQGNAGIVSIFRLKNELYGLKPDEHLLFDRFIKEINHELGHTFGLTHCFTPSCVMRSGVYIEDVDQKESGFCSKCSSRLMHSPGN